MTIQLNIGSQPLQPLRSLSKEAHWVKGLPDDNLSNLAELGELNSLKLQYTSLRDLIVVSPIKRGSRRVKELEWCDLSQVKFKDKLLKQAARAYLQPIGKEATPETHFFAQCWKSFIAKNKSLVVSVKEYLQRHVEACVKFFRTQAFNLIQQFKPHYLGSLCGRPNKST